MVKANLKKTIEKIRKGELKPRAYPNQKETQKEKLRREEIARQWTPIGRLNQEGYLIYPSDLKQIIKEYYGKDDLAKQLLDIQPLYYDNSKLWWTWEKKEYKWKIIDETDILNYVNFLTTANTVNSKEKIEILEALKQESRLRKPKPIKPTWIQFKDMIMDIDTGERIEATPEYFVTNPIPWELNKDNFEDTPNMDRIFEEWVGKDHVKTLYEVISYCMLPDYPIHRLFCFIGAGMNGKSCFLRLLKKFIGRENTTSTELDDLISSRFEKAKLYKKLVCEMGETNFSEISKTSIIKKLTGQDSIGFEYKNKNPFDDINYAKILIATNNLPTTTDKTIGFYRRWSIIDFLNQFSEEKDILDDIPDKEYESLALKSCIILKDILKKRKFHKEGSIEERAKKYEDKSNPLDKFLKTNTIEDLNEYITKADFYKKLNQWCKENRFREIAENTVGKKMKEIGIEDGKKHFDWMNDGKGGQARIWLGIKWRTG